MQRFARFFLWSGFGLLVFSCASMIPAGFETEPKWLILGLLILGLVAFTLSWVFLAIGAVLKAIVALRRDP